jgi:selenocysteine lyase/cysteine desulfurase
MPSAQVGLVENTTAACDAALLALAAGVQTFVHTTGAHPTIRRSILQTVRTVSRFGGPEPQIREVELGPLDKRSAQSCAEQFVAQVLRLVGDEPAVLVVEQVTYRHGLRLPLEAIVDALRAARANLRIVVDGAQAVGLWHPPPAAVDAFIGCFHKAAGGPPATAFIAIDAAWAGGLPSHVAVQGELPASLGVLPTVDLQKWTATRTALVALDRRSGLSSRQRRITRFNSALDEGLTPVTVTLGRNCDPQLRSHISAIRTASEDSAMAVVAALLGAGFVVQAVGVLVRISAGPDVQPDWGLDVGKIVGRHLTTA